MRPLALYLLIVLLASSAYTTDACRSKNPFIESLARKGVKIFETPETAKDDTCKDFWSANKTCCDSRSLIEYADQDEKNQLEALAEVNREFEAYHRLLSTLRSNLKFIRDIDIDKWDLSNEDLMAVKEKAGDEIKKTEAVANTILNLEFLRDFPNMASLEEFQKANNHCWNQMVTIRKVVLCPTCSGDSQNYFLNSKAFLQESTCVNIIKECSTSLKGLVLYLRGLTRMNKILSIESWTDGLIQFTGNEGNYKIKAATKFFKKFFKNHIRSIVISNQLQQELSSSSSNLLARTLCRLVVSVNTKTLLEQIAALFNGEGVSVQLIEPLREVKEILKIRENGDADKINENQNLPKYKLDRLSEIDQKENNDLKKAFSITIANAHKKLKVLTRSTRRAHRSRHNAHWSSKFSTFKFTNRSASRQLKKDRLRGATPSDIFNSDVVIMKKSDNMFSSYDGVKGSTLDNQYSNAKPMDISKLRFP